MKREDVEPATEGQTLLDPTNVRSLEGSVADTAGKVVGAGRQGRGMEVRV